MPKVKRTQEEILKRIEERKVDDFLAFEIGEYVDFLDFNHAQPFLKEGTKKEDWKYLTDPIKKMREYMDFAWDKANGCRGISANRSISHMVAWLWLAGEDEFLKELEDIEYEHYGKEKLIAICNKYKIDWKKYDDGIRTNTG